MLRNLRLLLSKKTYNQNGVSSNRKLHPTSQLLEVRKSEAVEDIHGIDIKYSEQEGKILGIINESTLSELLCYEISKGRANKLIAWRKRKGLLKKLSDIFFVDGFEFKSTDKFFQSLLLEPKANEDILNKALAKKKTFTVPSVEMEQRKSIKSCLSVHIGINSITWCRLTVPNHDISSTYLITDWDHHEISRKKLHLHELILRCMNIVHLLPTADCYLFENPQVAVINNNKSAAEQQNINVERAQVTAIFAFALAFRNNQTNDAIDENIDSIHSPNVFYIKRPLTSRLYNRLVGTERVSTEEIILNIMSKSSESPLEQSYQTKEIQQPCKENLNFSGRVHFPATLRSMFSNAPRYHRDFLGHTLLMNLTFIRLVLLQDSASIALVIRRSNANSTT